MPERNLESVTNGLSYIAKELGGLALSLFLSTPLPLLPMMGVCFKGSFFLLVYKCNMGVFQISTPTP